MQTLAASAGLLALLSLRPVSAVALPLYASREGATCVTCHVDPNGGGIRKEFGFYYSKNRHSMGVEDKWSNVTVNPQLNDWIRLGIDMRFMYYASHYEGENPFSAASTFFPMQGQINIAVTPMDQLTIVATHGIVTQDNGFFGDPYIAREIYALFPRLPWNGFAQVGRFRLPFGLRQDDHTSFVRTPAFLIFDSQVPDAGIEIGSIGKRFFGQFSLTNGAPPFTEQARVYTGKIGCATKAFQAAVSGLHRASDSGMDERIERWSGYLTATRGRLTVLGEYAGGTTKDHFNVVTPVVNSEAAFGELVYRASRGVWIRGKIDWMDSDRQVARTERRRYLLECDVNPMPFTNIKVSYRYYNEDLSPNWNEYFAMLFVPF